MIKDVLVHLSPADKNHAATAYALALAELFDAHVAGVAFAYEPVIGASVMGAVPTDFIEAQRQENIDFANAAKAKFEESVRRERVSAESHVFSASMAGAADQFGRMARRFDLSVVIQADQETVPAEELIAESALFVSGRPVIVVPYIHTGELKLERVMVCWDGGRAAARAIGDAMPFLTRAKAVEVVMVLGEEGKQDSIPGADMGQHLARHGVTVEVKRIVATGKVEETLLSHAADMSADLVVMGGYGHSRLREFILGGVTRGMLASMTVPCFMSH
ncbi:MAG TPA: universal stress protein [Xanthobacteraceae bacterium]|nr:universal stress protein [Xanthobacteraceae bacterium]